MVVVVLVVAWVGAWVLGESVWESGGTDHKLEAAVVGIPPRLTWPPHPRPRARVHIRQVRVVVVVVGRVVWVVGDRYLLDRHRRVVRRR